LRLHPQAEVKGRFSLTSDVGRGCHDIRKVTQRWMAAMLPLPRWKETQSQQWWMVSPAHIADTSYHFLVGVWSTKSEVLPQVALPTISSALFISTPATLARLKAGKIFWLATIHTLWHSHLRANEVLGNHRR